MPESFYQPSALSVLLTIDHHDRRVLFFIKRPLVWLGDERIPRLIVCTINGEYVPLRGDEEQDILAAWRYVRGWIEATA